MDTKTIGIAVVVIGIVVVAGFIGMSMLPESGQTTTTTTKTTTTTDGVDNGFIPIVDYVESTYDGTGFADVPGGNATLESTYNALRLLEAHGLENAESLQDEFANISESIKNTQQPMGYFGMWNDSALAQAMKTGYSVACLKIMGEYDSEIEEDVTHWFSYHRAWYEFERWLSDGVFINKYWDLWAAVQAGRINLVTYFNALTIENNVFDPGDDTGMEDIVLYTGQIHFQYHFTDKSFEERLKRLETFEHMVYYKYERPTIINLLVNATSTIEDIVAQYDSTTGVFNTSALESYRRFRILASLGALDEVFTNSTKEARLALFTTAVESVVDILPRECNPDSSVSEILGLTLSWTDVDLWTRA